MVLRRMASELDTSHTPASADPAPGPAQSLPGLRDPLLWLVLAATFGLQLFAWSRLEGYQLADAVEYMDRAWAVARGEPLDPSTVRSFAPSALLLPYFWVAELLRLEDLRPVVSAVRLGQMAMGLFAVTLLVRAATRRAGRATGLASGAMLGLNPLFAQYTISPLSATAALLAMTLALAGLSRVERREQATFARGLATGAGLGAGLLMAFKTIPIIGLLIASTLFVRAWRRQAHLAGIATAIGAAVVVQGLLDRATYGSFGASLGTYLLNNVAPMLATQLYRLGFDEIAFRIYEVMPDAGQTSGGVMRTRFPRSWYLTELPHRALAWPALTLTAVGALAAVRRGMTLTRIALFVAAIYVGLLSLKGHKTFRLWMPLLPFIALVGGAGWGALFSRPSTAPPRGTRAWIGVLALVAVGAGSAFALSNRNLSKYGGYWRAMASFEELIEEVDAPLRVASAYDWAARFREAPGLELVKLPAHLDQWSKLDEAQRTAILDTLGGLDGFIGHLQVIEQDPRILREVNERFEVHEVIDDRAVMEELEPIYVLRRRTGDPLARTFYERFEDTGPGEANWPPSYQARIQYPRSVDFRRRMPDGSVRQMVLLGVDVDFGLCDGEQAWITYHWYAGPLGGGDYTVVDRFTDRAGHGYNGNHRPTRGAIPTSDWVEGEIVRESFLTRFGPHPSQFGGPWRRGDRQPVELWMAIVEFDEEQRAVGGLAPFHASGGRPIHRERAGAGLRSDDGRVWSDDALLKIGGFWMPVPDALRLPDDGRPVPDAPTASAAADAP